MTQGQIIAFNRRNQVQFSPLSEKEKIFQSCLQLGAEIENLVSELKSADKYNEHYLNESYAKCNQLVRTMLKTPQASKKAFKTLLTEKLKLKALKGEDFGHLN